MWSKPDLAGDPFPCFILFQPLQPALTSRWLPCARRRCCTCLPRSVPPVNGGAAEPSEAPPMAYCCVPGCESCQGKEGDRDLSFHRFPSHPPTRRAWIDRIKMLEECVDPYFQVTDSSRVCGRHFADDCKVRSLTGLSKLRRGSLPTVFTGCRAPARRSVVPLQRVLQQQVKATAPQIETDPGEAAEPLHDHSYSKRPLSAREQLQAARLELELELGGEWFFLRHLQHEPEAIVFYTGFKDYGALKAFYLALRPTAETVGKWSPALGKSTTGGEDGGSRAHQLCMFDQLFLFLCCVRRGGPPGDMSTRLRLSQDVAWATCVTWCRYLFSVLGALPVWPSRRAVDELMPPFFRTTFPKTRVVLALTEIRIQLAARPADPSCRTGVTTLKSVVGIAPSGSVSFVGGVCAASVSDEDVVRESGILDLLEPGDEVMTDTSLEISGPLGVLGVNLVSPASLGPDAQRGGGAAARGRDIGHLKAHVRRAIGRIREYHVFDDVVPSALRGSVNQLWTVCALLTNFQAPLI